MVEWVRSPFTSTPLAAAAAAAIFFDPSGDGRRCRRGALSPLIHTCAPLSKWYLRSFPGRSELACLRFQFCHFLRTHNDDDDTKGGSRSARTSTCAVKIHKVQRCTVYTHEEGKIYMRRKSSPLSKGGKSEQEEEEDCDRGGEKRSFCISHTAAAAVAVSASAAEKISSTFPFPPTNDDADDPSHSLDLSRSTSSFPLPPRATHKISIFYTLLLAASWGCEGGMK